MNLLIQRGFTFEVEDEVVASEPRWLGLGRIRHIAKTKRKFKVEEPTLGTLDRLSAEWIELAVDEQKMKSPDIDEATQAARELVIRHTRRCARIIALAVIGREYYVTRLKNGKIERTADIERLEELTETFVRCIKPSDLHGIIAVINIICNLGDFVNAIRLMLPERTTMPRLIADKGV